MHLRLRTKLILSISVPLVITYAAMMVWDYNAQMRRAEDMVEGLVLGRASLTVGILDGRLVQVQQFAAGAADVIQRQERFDAMLRLRLLGSMRQIEGVVGMVVAMDAGSSMVIRRGGPGGGPLGAQQGASDLPSGFDYRSPNCTWYLRAKATGQPLWSTPSESAGIFPASTIAYTVPLLDEGQFKGVVSVHVSPGVFRWTRTPRRSPVTESVAAAATQTTTYSPGLFEAYGDHYLIVTGKGEVIFHSPERVPLPASLRDPSFDSLRESLRTVLAAAEANRADIVPFQMGPRGVFTFEPHENYWLTAVPLRGGDYVFLTAYPQRQLMGPIHSATLQRAGFLGAGLLAILAIVWFAARRISRPIEELESATRVVGEGDFSAAVPERRGHDEVATLSRMFNQMLQRIRDQVARIREESSARAKVESELQLGRAIQTGLLPKTLPHGQFELHATNLPANHVAGDFYDFFIDSKGRLTLVIADVAGHGVAAALMMAVTRTLVRNLATGDYPLVDTARRMNVALLEDNRGDMFVTLVLATYDPSSGTLAYVNAGHPAPLLLKPDGSVTPLGASTAPLLGAMELRDSEFSQEQVKLDVGDTLVFYTDGIPEAMHAQTGEMMGEKRLCQTLSRAETRSLREIERAVIEAVESFNNGPLKDDVTLLLLRRV